MGEYQMTSQAMSTAHDPVQSDDMERLPGPIRRSRPLPEGVSADRAAGQSLPRRKLPKWLRGEVDSPKDEED